MSYAEKDFNDPIHGHMRLHRLLVDIINTREFNRLRYIKQLGGRYYVYPGASFNRFEHSIGVSYLAGEFIRKLRYEKGTSQPREDISDEDELCVMVAGLCHDIGHGPFSHVFEDRFLHRIGKTGDEYKHEETSCRMFDQMYKKMKTNFENAKLKDADIEFIKQLIRGEIKNDVSPEDVSYKELRLDKPFLYEIVSNHQNEIDVDKWDYFTRDCHALGLSHTFDYRRLLRNATIREVPSDGGKKHIVYRDKVGEDIHELFHTRDFLHRRSCQHKTNNAIEIMVGEALCLADDENGYKIRYTEGEVEKECRLSESMMNVKAYISLTDYVVELIPQECQRKGASANLIKAGKLLDRIVERDLYKQLAENFIPLKLMSDDEAKQVKKWLEEEFKKSHDFPKDVAYIDVVRFASKLIPGKVWLYKKDGTITSLDKYPHLVPFPEIHIRLYCTHSKTENDEDEEHKAKRWFENALKRIMETSEYKHWTREVMTVAELQSH